MNNFYYYDKMREQHHKDIASEIEARKILKHLKASKANNQGVLKRLMENVQSLTVSAVRILECFIAYKLYTLLKRNNAGIKPCWNLRPKNGLEDTMNNEILGREYSSYRMSESRRLAVNSGITSPEHNRKKFLAGQIFGSLSNAMINLIMDLRCGISYRIYAITARSNSEYKPCWAYNL